MTAYPLPKTDNASDERPRIAFTLNGQAVSLEADPGRRTSELLREDLGLTGTKVGCDAGDCGACTVLLDGQQVCACLTPAARLEGAELVTVEGLAGDPRFAKLQAAFRAGGAVQCGICTPGMLMAAAELLDHNPAPDQAAVEDALGGVLCRCTGYKKIVTSVLAAAASQPVEIESGGGVGRRFTRPDAAAKTEGSAVYGADGAPADALSLRVLRSPHPHAEFRLGNLDGLLLRHPGLVSILTAEDIQGTNGFGIYPDVKDQPVLAEGYVRYRGEAVLALVGTAEAVAAVSWQDIPITWSILPVYDSPAAALAPDAPVFHVKHSENILIEGLVERGDAAAADTADLAVEGAWSTGFVEHAYIEPEAGWARPCADGGVEVAVTTQTPYMDRDEVALVLGIAPERVRIRPTVCGGGFGGKLDHSVAPVLGVAAKKLGRAVRCTYSRSESMAATTKRHPAEMTARLTARSDGTLVSFDFSGDFDTGAYASWGPTVAGRVPVHASGPYRVPRVRAKSRAIYTNNPPAGAFRGFGVPQAALVHEGLMDALAQRLGIDPLELRIKNALRVGDSTPTGQVLQHSVGLVDCLQALKPRWAALRAEADAFNRKSTHERMGLGVACMWYGCGNTALSNPSSMRVALRRDGRVILYNGAQEIGQGSSIVMQQILAETLGIDAQQIHVTVSDTDLTLDAGKTSASRQTFVSGRATQLAGEALKVQLRRIANAGEDAEVRFHDSAIEVIEPGNRRRIDLAALPAVPGYEGEIAEGIGTFDPPTTSLDAQGQGTAYATYAFGAQIAQLIVDLELGTVQVRRIVAAHDVGRAINPELVEGQIHGGIAQGLGMALMEEYLPGRTENLHDYLIPTVGDMPEIETLLIESPEPLGPFGAKGVGEPALVPTAPAILGAIDDATGVRLTRIPALPHRVLAALKAKQ